MWPKLTALWQDSVEIVVDATPPEPEIVSPAAFAVVHDSLRVYGTTVDTRFAHSRVEIRAHGRTGGWTPLGMQLESPIRNGVAAVFDTRSFPDGEYELRLSVEDNLGLVGLAQIRITIDNAFPPVELTSPHRVIASRGGVVYSANRDAKLTIPLHALGQDATVIVAPVGDLLPSALPGGALRWTEGDSLDWFTLNPDSQAVSVPLLRQLILDLRCAACETHQGGGAIYRRAMRANPDWIRIGGTCDASRGLISVPVEAGGVYAVYEDREPDGSGGGITSLAASPRILSPRLGAGASELAIRFALGRSGGVTVRIFNRAGREVRVLALDRPMAAGQNVLRWDGLNEDHVQVGADMYFVTVEACGERKVATVAVSR